LEDYAGEMKYLSRNLDIRFDPRRLLPAAQSIIVIGINYFPTPEDEQKREEPYRVARYAWGEDYHNVLRNLLKKMRRHLRSTIPTMKGRICVDTAPFMDKYWAQAAGLGWQGKHTNLVSRDFGSWLLLGSLVINAAVDRYDSPGLNHCGQCHACLDSCPTGALFEPYKMNATRCISYWTIESKAPDIPENISSKQNKWVFGCDICISVCPFNKFEKPRGSEAFKRKAETTLVETGRITSLSVEEFKSTFAKSPINRPGLTGLIRNIRSAKNQV
jgi:epoxyqueuosine reductase